MFIRCMTYEDVPESIWINPSQCAILKYHPSERKPKAGYVCLACGKEFFIQLQDFTRLLKDQDALTTPKTN
jgi:hypothetical protein